MVIIVVMINLLLASYGFYLAWQIWQLRRALAQAADALIAAEQSTHNVLRNAPEAILRGELGARQLRQNYQDLQPKFKQAKQALTLLRLSQRLVNRQLKVTRLPSPVKKARANRK